MFMWIAYAGDRLFLPLPAPAFSSARTIVTDTDGAGVALVGPVQMNSDWSELKGNELRAWAWLQVAAAYGAERLQLSDDGGDIDTTGKALTDESDFKLLFGKAEAAFGLPDAMKPEWASAEKLVSRYRAVELAVSKHVGSHREQRHSIEIAHMWLVAAGRSIWLHATLGDQQAAENAESDLREAQRLIGGMLGDAGRVVDLTLFSHLQRRAVTVPEFRNEMEAFVEQAHDWKPLLPKGQDGKTTTL
jgi:hypothetical protein